MAGRRGILVIVVLVVAWGSTFAAVKIGVSGSPPVLFAGLRSLVGGAAMASLAALRRGGPRVRGNAGVYMLLTMLNVIGFFGLQTLAIWELPSGLAAVLIYLQPVMTGVLASPLLGERLGVNKIAGLLLAFSGIVVVSAGAVTGQVSGLGVAYAVGSALVWALGTIAFKHTQGRVDPWWAVALPFLVGGGVLTVAGVVGEGARVQWSWPFATALVYASLVGTALAWALWFALVGSGEASRASTYIFFVPLVSLVIGALFLDEHIGLSLLAGSAAVVAGVSLVNRATRQDPGPRSNPASSHERQETPQRSYLGGSERA
jgi:O-acetylserine/cysteine efflux transporter